MSIWSTLASIAGPVIGGLVAGPAGAAIGGGLSALGSGLAQDESNTNYLRGVNDTNAVNKAIADANNAEAWKRLQSTNQFNERMWEKNNAYNSPAAMLMRLRQAGLNPAAFTGESPASQITSQAPPQMSTPTMQAPGQTPVADYGHLMTERLYANELLKGKQIENADNSLRLSFLAQEKKNELLKQAADISNMKAKTVETQWATKKLAQDYEHFARIADDVARGVAASSDSLEQNIRIQDEQNQRAWMQEGRENARMVMEIAANEAGLRLTEQSIRTSAAMASQASASAEGMRQENRIKKIQADFEEKFNKVNNDGDIAGTTNQQITLAYLTSMARENADAETVNQWLRAHAKYLGMGLSTAIDMYKSMLQAGLSYGMMMK